MEHKGIRVIITGTTGMVGEGVLHECLLNPKVASVLVINRRQGGIIHPKLKEVIHADFFDLKPVEAHLSGYNACFFCLGVSSVGMDKDAYYNATYTLTMNVANTLCRLNPGMSFCYVSGTGTDSTEKGRSNWARVKGKTENDLMKLPFRQTFAFRPGFIKPTPGLTRTHKFYKYVNWMFPIGRALSPNTFCTMKELALAMINIVGTQRGNSAIEGKEIIALGKN